MFFMLKARAGGAGLTVSSAKPADIRAMATIPASNLREPRKFLVYILNSCQMTGGGIETDFLDNTCKQYSIASSLGRGRNFLPSDQIVVGFPGADAVDCAVLDEQFRGSESTVVVAGHDKTIGSGDL